MKQIKEYGLEYNEYKLKFLNIGAAITEYSYKGQNTVLYYENKENYVSNDIFLGAVVGRTAGRIRDGRIGKWQLPLNQGGKHNLHGNELHHKHFDVEIEGNNAILTCVDQEGPYPGNAVIKIIYSLGKEGLKQEIIASSDSPTVFNFANHTYFNLDGTETILDHKLKINSKKMLAVDEDCLPVKEVKVENTVFDFRAGKAIREALNDSEEQYQFTKFIDHPFELDGLVELEGEKIKLVVETGLDYAVIYCGAHISGTTHIIGESMNRDYAAVCIETQHAPNTTDLVSEYNSITHYKIKEK